MSIINVGSGSTDNVLPFELRVSMGLEEGMSIIDKFGTNPDVDTSTTPEYIWELGGEYPWGNDAGETLYLSSSDNTDTMDVDVLVWYVDDSGDWIMENITHTMQGQTKVALTVPDGYGVARCHRIENMGNTGQDITGQIYAYYDTTVTAGVPDDLTKVLSSIINGANQTKQATFTIPSGYWGFLFRGEAGVTKGFGTDECDFAYVSRREGKVFKEKKDFGTMTQGQNNYSDKRSFPDIIPAKTDLAIKSTNVSANNMSCWATLDILLVTDERLEKELRK